MKRKRFILTNTQVFYITFSKHELSRQRVLFMLNGLEKPFIDILIRQPLIILYLLKLMKLLNYILKQFYGYASVICMIIDQRLNNKK